MQSSKHKAAIGFIFITLLIDVIGFGIIIPVIPKLIAQLKGVSLSEASRYGGYLITSFAIAQFIFSPIMGALSDQYGRRPVLLISLLGFSIDYLILAWAPSYAWLLIGRILAGITGASFTTASAYIADISDESNRAQNFGMLGAAFGLGFILGPSLGGFLGSINERFPFHASTILCIANLLYGYFILPESLPLEKRRKVNLRTINPFATLLKLRKYNNIGWLLFAFFFLYLGAHAVQSNWSFFTQHQFNWSPKMVGISLSVVGVIFGLSQTVLVKKAIALFGEPACVYIGFALYTIGMLSFAFATEGWMMFLFMIPYCLGGISGPCMQSIMSAKVSEKEQGELQGGLTSLQSLTTIFGPIIMTTLFAYVTSENAVIRFSGMPFILGATLMFISAIITYFLLRPKQY